MCVVFLQQEFISCVWLYGQVFDIHYHNPVTFGQYYVSSSFWLDHVCCYVFFFPKIRSHRCSPVPYETLQQIWTLKNSLLNNLKIYSPYFLFWPIGHIRIGDKCYNCLRITQFNNL